MKAPEPDERLRVFFCIGCEQISLLGDANVDDHKRLECPHCHCKVPPNSIWEYVRDYDG